MEAVSPGGVNASRVAVVNPVILVGRELYNDMWPNKKNTLETQCFRPK